MSTVLYTRDFGIELFRDSAGLNSREDHYPFPHVFSSLHLLDDERILGKDLKDSSYKVVVTILCGPEQSLH
jgi:hypothetical protein